MIIRVMTHLAAGHPRAPPHRPPRDLRSDAGVVGARRLQELVVEIITINSNKAMITIVIIITIIVVVVVIIIIAIIIIIVLRSSNGSS